LDGGNRAFSELYQIRGEVFLAQGQRERAKEEFEKALLYNRNYKPAKEALASF
jgi:predicted negative regulator of RcsB-dependent stress response